MLNFLKKREPAAVICRAKKQLTRNKVLKTIDRLSIFLSEMNNRAVRNLNMTKASSVTDRLLITSKLKMTELTKAAATPQAP